MTRPTTIPAHWTAEDIERERAAAAQRLAGVMDRVYARIILRRVAEAEQEEAAA